MGFIGFCYFSFAFTLILCLHLVVVAVGFSILAEEFSKVSLFKCLLLLCIYACFPSASLFYIYELSKYIFLCLHPSLATYFYIISIPEEHTFRQCIKCIPIKPLP